MAASCAQPFTTSNLDYWPHGSVLQLVIHTLLIAKSVISASDSDTCIGGTLLTLYEIARMIAIVFENSNENTRL